MSVKRLDHEPPLPARPPGELGAPARVRGFESAGGRLAWVDAHGLLETFELRERSRLENALSDAVSVRDIFEVALEMSRPMIDRAGHEIVISTPPASLHVDADLTRLAQVLGNLLDNAAKYMDRGGGRIAAASDGPGRGTTFRVALPVARGAADIGDGDGSRSARTAGGGLRILVVDDNVDSASTMAMFLEICGHTIRVAHDGVDAVSEASDFRPDVVLMDIGLPGMNGHEAGRAIRAESWGEGVVLIALSGWGQDADRQRSRDAGFNHHLVKPVDHAVLSQILTQTAEVRGLRHGRN